jgi:hypothetical protein
LATKPPLVSLSFAALRAANGRVLTSSNWRSTRARYKKIMKKTVLLKLGVPIEVEEREIEKEFSDIDKIDGIAKSQARRIGS